MMSYEPPARVESDGPASSTKVTPDPPGPPLYISKTMEKGGQIEFPIGLFELW